MYVPNEWGGFIVVNYFTLNNNKYRWEMIFFIASILVMLRLLLRFFIIITLRVFILFNFYY